MIPYEDNLKVIPYYIYDVYIYIYIYIINHNYIYIYILFRGGYLWFLFRGVLVSDSWVCLVSDSQAF